MDEVFSRFKMVELKDKQLLDNQYKELLYQCYSDKLEGYVPAQYENISNLYNVIMKLFENKREVIVFALDAISFNYFFSRIIPNINNMDNKKACALSSVFPSTSATCWSSVLTNSLPSEHAIYGTSFRHEEKHMNYVWHRNYYCQGNKTILNQTKDNKFQLVLAKDNIFQRVVSQGIVAYDIGHYFKDNPSNPLLNSLTKGSIRIRCMNNYLDLMENPEKLLQYCIGEIEKIMSRKDEKKLIWAYIDTDNYIHHKGYDELENDISWKELFNFWDEHYSEDRAYVFLSDHGQIIQNNVKVDILKESIKNLDLSCNTGGAGRVLYIFPQKDKYDDVYGWLNEMIGDSGKIYTKEELIMYGLIDSDSNGIERIGDLIAIGYKDNFPSTGPNYLFEHGALSEDEMFVPLVIMN